MAKENAAETLAQRVEILCARCDALGRQIRALKGENRRMQQKLDNAKTKIRAVIAQIPEVPAEETNP